MRFAVFAALLLTGCAQSAVPDREGTFDHGVLSLEGPTDLALTTTDLASAPADLAPATDLAASADLASSRDLGVAAGCTPIINEVQTSITGDATNEFVELYNPCPDLYLDGYRLAYRAASNSSAASMSGDGTLLFSWGHVLFGHAQYLVLGGSGFTGHAAGALQSGLADDGAIGLRNANGNLIDSMAYGAVNAMNAFIVGSPAMAPGREGAPGKSLSLLPDGNESANNGADYHVTTPTPGAANH